MMKEMIRFKSKVHSIHPPSPKQSLIPSLLFKYPSIQLVKHTPAQLLDALKIHSLPCGLLVLLFQGVLQPYIPI